MNRYRYTLASILFAFTLLTGSLQATNYYTISSGNFNDNGNVWSNDGTNACGCAPAASFVNAGDTIFIRHEIILNQELSIQNNAHLSISSSGLLNGSFGIRMDNNASLFNAGSLQPGFLFVFNSTLVSTGSISTAGSYLNLASTSDLSGSVHVGFDFRTMHSGTLILRSNTFMNVDGFFFNIGTLITEPGVCINIGGDFFSAESGIVIGDGHVTAGFNITNNGAWDINTGWCAGVDGFGMPNTENCITCGPLPVTLQSFDAAYQMQEQNVRLIWNTLNEVNSDHFVVERSLDGIEFEVVREEKSLGSDTKEAHYEWVDETPGEGMNYYRLRQIDRDGQQQVLGTEKVYVSATANTSFVAWPQPTQGQLQFQLSLEEARSLDIIVLDLAGRIVLQQSSSESDAHHGHLDLSQLDAGTYILRAKAGTFTHSQKITKI